ncbi:MAG TPA: HAMP domain-containing sensor histidine kinase, partial [Candidatus Melainabacteria bacterium]|nr:HAMP domain-containing sensor histidine kinase [Candidatus Melainabacteria bacterium]
IIIAVETILKEIAASTTTAIIYNVSRRPDLLTRLEESHEEIRSSSARLMRLTRDDDMERSEAARLNASARDWIKNHEKVVNSDPKNRLGAFVATSGNVGNLLLVHSEGSSKTIIDRERQIQTVEPQLFRDSIFRIQILLLFGAVVNITITFFLARYFARYISQRLDNVLTNTFKLGARMELNPPMRGDDEIAELDQALHQTASEIMEFESFKEQLIGVVSHEMRTPLTSIQGTLTLLQAGAMGDYPQALHRSVDETQTQLTRLIHLVNDLLLVERLESGSQVIKQENINLPYLI